MTNGRLYSGLIVLSGPPITIQAYATGANHSPSAVVSASYTLAAYAPGFSRGTGTYNSAQSVTLTDADRRREHLSHHERIDPTPSSTPYTGPFTVSATETVNAMATYPRFSNSTVSSATYTIQSPAATLSPSRRGGWYNGTQTMTISDTTPERRFTTQPTAQRRHPAQPCTRPRSVFRPRRPLRRSRLPPATPPARWARQLHDIGSTGNHDGQRDSARAVATITITGSGFGTQAAYSATRPYIAFDDNSGVVWGAGNGGDAVGLDVTSWTNTQIVIAGLPEHTA